MRTPLALLLLASSITVASAQSAPPASADLKALSARAEKELRGNILPFWLEHSRDRVHGGFHGAIDGQMKIDDAAPRGALLTSRILWTFSAAYRRYPDPQYLEMARWAYHDLMDRFRDREQGGLFWSISADGQPLDTRKQIYGQVFGIYGLTEFYRATGDKAALDAAVEIFRVMDRRAHDEKYLGYFDACTRDWGRPPRDDPSILGSTNVPKSQNSHIHILEAFTNLLRVWPDEGLRARQRELLELILTRIVDSRTHHLVLFMQGDWTPIGAEYSYGHDIELSWLLGEAAEVLGDPALTERVKPVALGLAQATLTEGVDADGGVFNDGNARGPTNTHKDWWGQAEAAVGFLNAYQLSQDPRYFAAARHSWDFIEQKIVDRKNGDWLGSVERDGTPVPYAKQSVWKCPYHNSRSCLELIDRLGKLAGTSRD
jgi:mannobiose 2-epimerase